MPEQPVTQMTADEFREKLRERGWWKSQGAYFEELWRHPRLPKVLCGFLADQWSICDLVKDQSNHCTNPADLLPLIDGYMEGKG